MPFGQAHLNLSKARENGLPLNYQVEPHNYFHIDVNYPDLSEFTANRLLENDPLDVQGQCLKSAALRLQGEAEQSLYFLTSSDAQKSENPLILQELGFVYRQLGDFDNAAQFFRKAVSIDDCLVSSLRALDKIVDIGKADSVEKRTDLQRPVQVNLRNIPKLIRNKKYRRAIALCETFLQFRPNHETALRYIATILRKQNLFDKAALVLEKCLGLNPGNHKTRAEYARILMETYEYGRALEEIDISLTVRPRDINYLVLKGNILSHAGQNKEAFAHIEKSLNVHCENPKLLICLGNAKRASGNFVGAVKAFQDAAIKECRAFSSLANLKKYTFTDHELCRMHELYENANVKSADYYYLAFALGKAYEDQGKIQEAFHYYRQGNEVKFQELGFEIAKTESRINRVIATVDEDKLAAGRNMGYADTAPIFIVGLPRSGSTLLEQILSSHSQIDATKELKDISEVFHSQKGKSIEKIGLEEFLQLSPEMYRNLGERYIERTYPLRSGNSFFVDKMPGNFNYIGFIALILPNAKIIDARRHPMAAGFSNFKQLFAHGQGFSYNLESMGRYYQKYVELMNHWDRCLPGKILRVNYEDVVNNIEAEVGRILNYCGLPFEEECLSFHKSKRSVRTFSSEQVRSPLYTDSLEIWKEYGDHLAPLRQALGSTIEIY